MFIFIHLERLDFYPLGNSISSAFLWYLVHENCGVGSNLLPLHFNPPATPHPGNSAIYVFALLGMPRNGNSILSRKFSEMLVECSIFDVLENLLLKIFEISQHMYKFTVLLYAQKPKIFIPGHTLQNIELTDGRTD